jgi:ABC-type Fe3+/spermidine/putrescine transport system ATPase subunit
MAAGTPIVEAREITKRFTHGETAFTALDQVSVEVYEGEFLAIVGPSGCGKSTLLHIMAGLKRPDGGAIHIVRSRDHGRHAEAPRGVGARGGGPHRVPPLVPS